jgi:plastocyanin
MRSLFQDLTLIIVSAGLIVLAGLGCAAEGQPPALPPPTPTPSAVAVMIRDFQFRPDSLTIKKGTTVTWTNMDSVQHTVTRPTEGGIQVAGPDSPILNKGETYSYTYDTVGIFDYHCRIHPFLKGSVVVIAQKIP